MIELRYGKLRQTWEVTASMAHCLRGASPRSRCKRSRRKGEGKGVVARRGLEEA